MLNTSYMWPDWGRGTHLGRVGLLHSLITLMAGVGAFCLAATEGNLKILVAIRVGMIGLLTVGGSFTAFGQGNARLQTADTELVFEAGPNTPRLVSLDAPGQPRWENRASESLMIRLRFFMNVPLFVPAPLLNPSIERHH